MIGALHILLVIVFVLALDLVLETALDASAVDQQKTM